MATQPSRTLEAVPNQHPDRDYEVSMVVPEFTCLCPLKLYLWSYRQEGAFHEDVTNRILDDFVAAARPRWAEVVGDFNVRGGIKTEVRAVYGKRAALDG